MFEQYKKRMTHHGNTTGEALRLQSNMVIEQTWYRDPNARKVYVVRVTHGLPEVTSQHQLIDVKFNVESYQKVNTDEPSYYLQFRHGAEKQHPDIGIGSYVYMADEDNEWKWWLIVGLDERPQFRQYHILECNWKFGWVVGGQIYYHYGILRNGTATREADDNSYTSVVNGNLIVWMATNADTNTIGYNQRFLISDVGRVPPLCYSVTNISDVKPVGLTKFVMSQGTFDPTHDNIKLMLADYYSGTIEPSSTDNNHIIKDVVVTYNGTKPTIKVGGSDKVFTAHLPVDNRLDIKWSLSDGINTYQSSYENDVQTFGDYTITTTDRAMKLRVAGNYSLVGTLLTITAECADGSVGQVQVEVIG